MTATALAEELARLDHQIAQLESRIAAGNGGITDHILLEATRRTHATTSAALAECHAERTTLPGVAPLWALEAARPAFTKPRAERTRSGLQEKAHQFWLLPTQRRAG